MKLRKFWSVRGGVVLNDWLRKITLLSESLDLDSLFTGLFVIPRDWFVILGNGFVILRKVLNELYVSGGFKGGTRTVAHLSSQFFFHFQAVFGKKLTKAFHDHLMIWYPLGNPGSATVCAVHFVVDWRDTLNDPGSGDEQNIINFSYYDDVSDAKDQRAERTRRLQILAVSCSSRQKFCKIIDPSHCKILDLPLNATIVWY